MTMFKLGSTLVVAIAALALAACAPAAPREAPGVAPAAKPAERPSPQSGGSLVFAAGIPNPTLHPFVGGTSTDILRVVGPIYERLVWFKYEQGKDYRTDFEIVPWLAESWEQPNDTTYIFKIRKGVKWHDGTEFTAQDVVFSYNWVRQEKFVASGRLTAASSIELMEPDRVKITLKAPNALFLTQLAGNETHIVPKHIYDRGEDFAKVAIGTGPFKLKKHDPTGENVYVKNEAYWQQGKPYMSELRSIWGLDRSAQLAAFVAGKNDLMALPDKPQLDAPLRSKPDAQYVRYNSDYGTALIMKLDQPPFNDLRVRRALHLATDRQAMIKTITFGEGTINPPGVPGMKIGWAIPNEELMKLPGYRQPKDQDIAEAKRLLADAGYPNGFQFRALYPGDKTTPPPVAEALATQLKSIGVNMILDPRDSATFSKLEKDGVYDTEVYLTTSANFSPRPEERFHSKGVLNKLGLSDPELDRLLEAIPTTMDMAKAKKVALDLQNYFLEKMYYIPTIDWPIYGVWQPWVHDYYAIPQVVVEWDAAIVGALWLEQGKMPPDRR